MRTIFSSIDGRNGSGVAGTRNSIPDESVIGILQAVVRDGRRTETDSLRLKLYGRVVVFLYPARRLMYKARRIAGAVKRRLKAGL